MDSKRCSKCGEEYPLSGFLARKGKCRKLGDIHAECRRCANNRRQLSYKNNPANRIKILERQHKQYRQLITETLEHYGGRCSCCGVSIFEFLTFDHINGRRPEHRNRQYSGLTLVKWIISNNYPEEIQVLCYNCNCAKGHHGGCPHNKESQDGDRNDRQQTLYDLEFA